MVKMLVKNRTHLLLLLSVVGLQALLLPMRSGMRPSRFVILFSFVSCNSCYAFDCSCHLISYANLIFFQVVLLESRDRIGGRVHTDYSFGFPVDLGASW